MLPTFVVLIIAAGAFFACRLLLKRTVLASIMFAAAVLLAGLFVTGGRIAFEYYVRARPEAYLLVDASGSCSGLADDPVVQGLMKHIPSRNVRYFAGSLSSSRSQVDPNYTALADSLRTLLGSLDENARVAVVSDFRDNRSLIEPFADPRVFALLSGETPSAPVVSGFEAPEFAQSGESFDVSATVYAPTAASVGYTLTLDGRVVSRGVWNLPQGESTISLKVRPASEGFALLELKTDGGDGAQRMIDVLPSFYKVWFAAGRPSAEFARVRRFFERIRWLKCDVRILARPGETLTIPQTGYDAYVLMDLSDAQVANPATVGSIREPVFYATGARRPVEIAGLLSAFTNLRLTGAPQDKPFRFGNTETVVRVIADVEPLMEVSPLRRVFFGWDTWKWDTGSVSLGIDENRFVSFWKAQAAFLIAGRSQPVELDRLNYFTGEPNPAGAATPGVHTFSTNGATYRILVTDNPAERPLPPDFNAARQFTTNVSPLESAADARVYLRTVLGTDKVLTRREFSFEFRKRPEAYIALVVILILFWLLGDLQKLKE